MALTVIEEYLKTHGRAHNSFHFMTRHFSVMKVFVKSIKNIIKFSIISISKMQTEHLGVCTCSVL